MEFTVCPLCCHKHKPNAACVIGTVPSVDIFKGPEENQTPAVTAVVTCDVVEAPPAPHRFVSRKKKL